MNFKKIGIVNFNVFSYDLSGKIDNAKLAESILHTQHLRFSDDFNSTRYEDNKLDLFDPEVSLLRKTVDDIFLEVDDRFIEPSVAWGHVVPPGGNTDIHLHETPELTGVSWCYYVSTPKNCGKIVFFPGFRDVRVEIEPKESTLLIFPTWIYHYTKTNYSEKNRISLSANKFFTKDQMNYPKEIVKEIYGPIQKTRS